MAQGVNESILGKLNECMKQKKVDIRTYSPLSLAYIGDAVYDLVIRTYVLSFGNTDNRKLHKKTTEYVSARAQAHIVENLLPHLTEEETDIYKRGRNAKPHSGAKNASESEYLKATGLEALIGWLYLSEKEDRMLELIHMAIHIIEDQRMEVM